jgi:hypothetical protein
MVLLASDYDKGRFFKAQDLDGSEKKVRIKSVTEEAVGPTKDKKLVVWFVNDDRGLVLNITNLRTLQRFGDDTDLWAGKIVVLFSMMVDFRGRMTLGLRVRIPPPKQVAASGNGAAKPKPPEPAVEASPAKQTRPDPELDDEPPAKPKSLADDLDDEIPWK